ncbi:MAG: hypothetical protein M0R74_07475 [Dehalococcoidia bacterium]|nr:hypothetical protein [Dehalococcoidia bacterium]
MANCYLVVDDSEPEGAAIERLLRKVDPAADVVRAKGAREALEVLEATRTVPWLTFIEGERQQWLEKAPVAMLSREMDGRSVVTSYRLGACAVLTKPVRPYELRETLRDFAKKPVVMAAGSVMTQSGPEREQNAA